MRAFFPQPALAAAALARAPIFIPEILCSFASAASNNSGAIAGFSANTVFDNAALGFVMWLGRHWPIIAVPAAVGALAAVTKKSRTRAWISPLPLAGAVLEAADIIERCRRVFIMTG